MARTIEEIVKDVDQADVEGLGRTDVEDVYQQMDHLMQVRPSPMDLYNRWEKQQWAVADELVCRAVHARGDWAGVQERP